MQKNTSSLWDQIWAEPAKPQKDQLLLLKEEHSIRWQRLEKIVLQEFGSFKNLKVLEIGAGLGTYGALFAKRGSKVTLLDYSEMALKRAHQFFKHNNLFADFVKQDALFLPDNLIGKFDVSMSFGLTEHFQGKQRLKINQVHFDVLKKGGLSFISVPNRYNLPYRLYKFAAELSGKWSFGEEYPYSRGELEDICQQIGIKDYSFFADCLWESFGFINPFKPLKNKLSKLLHKSAQIKKEQAVNKKINRLKIEKNKTKQQKGTFLDEYLSYALVLCGKKS